MPTFLLIGIPIVVAILLWAILSLPDEEVKEEEKPVVEDTPKPAPKPFKKATPKKKKKK